MNYKILEKLAKSDKWQILFNRSKEIGSLQLFNNNTDLSHLQVVYLYFLSLYSMLYQDLNSGEDFITEEIIEDSLRTEAYLLLRKELKTKKQNSASNKRLIDNVGGLGSVIFRKKRE